jgi:hypothetical protein
VECTLEEHVRRCRVDWGIVVVVRMEAGVPSKPFRTLALRLFCGDGEN